MAAETLSSVLDKISDHVGAESSESSTHSITLGEILDVVGRRAYGPILLIVGLLSISPLTAVPGLTWLFALMTLLVALQMAVSSKKLWLPKQMLSAEFPERKVAGAVRRMRPLTKFLDRIVRPRLEFLAQQPWLILIALAAAAAALITFPLGFIPFAPLIPGIAVVLIGLGVTARDGVVLAIAISLLGVACYFLASRFLF
jgi:hypothetical protein